MLARDQLLKPHGLTRLRADSRDKRPAPAFRFWLAAIQQNRSLPEKPYLRPIGTTPQIIAPKSGRNPRKFQTGCVAYCCNADGKPRSFIRAPKAAERWTVKNPPEAKI